MNIAKLISVRTDNSQKRAQCSECPYFKNIFVPSDIVHGGNMIIVGESPGEQESILSGDSGQLFRKTLNEVGFKVNEISFTNVCRCRPPEKEEPKKKAQELCTKLFLFNELRDLDPKLVLLAGATALNVFFPKESIMNKAGEFMEARGMVFLPVIHPDY